MDIHRHDVLGRVECVGQRWMVSESEIPSKPDDGGADGYLL